MSIPFMNHRYMPVVLLLATFVLLSLISPLLPQWLVRVPEELFIPVANWVNGALFFLLDDFLLIDIYDEELEENESIALVMLVSRFGSDVIQTFIDVIRNILLGGDKGFGLPALPWTAIAGMGAVIGYALKGWKLSLFSGLSVVFLSVFGQWIEAMQTLSLVVTAVPVCILLGLVLGVLSYKYQSVEMLLAPLLNIAQSLPHFSYLIPVVVFYGIGDHAGAIATIIFATPPMIRLTHLGLQKVPAEVVEAGKMSGCTNSQLLIKVLIPSARNDIMIGVNQVIMLCLAMVVIASFIGASGLGYKLLVMLNTLKIGKALELGVAIVLIAIVLDRLSLAWANKQPDYRANRLWYLRYKYPLICLAIIPLSIVLAQLTDYLYIVTESDALSTAWFWDAIVDWVVVNWFEPLQAFRAFLLIDVLIPWRDTYLALPAVAVFVLAVGGGYILGGIRSAITILFFIGFIAFTGWWDKAMITAYMVSFSVLAATIIGLSLGIFAARQERRARIVLVVCDTLQTFPSFVYLIPVIMLFQVNDVSVIFAVIIYAAIPATRYTIEGLRSVPQSLQDAATMSGTNSRQRLFSVSIPLALPHIMIGINQTVLFALFMVIIGAFIGTQDLGQEIMQALSESDMGKGLVLGLCVAFMGLAIDHLIAKWSRERKRRLGL